MADRIELKSPVSWREYYTAIGNNEDIKEKFTGSLIPQTPTWRSIEAYYNKKQDELEKAHPWFVNTPCTWNETFKKKLEQDADDEIKSKYINGENNLLINLKIRNYADLTPHHLISCNVTKAIHEHWKGIITNEIGYNVNCAENLLILTNIADVACYLSVPLHEGNHDNVVGISLDELNYYAESKISINNIKKSVWNENKASRCKGYHSKVFKLLTKVLIKYFEKCTNIDDIKFIKDMNSLSSIILRKIKNGSMILSEYGEDYLPGKYAGCRNVRAISTYCTEDEIKENRKNTAINCALKRNHDYLEYLFITSEIDVETRKKMGFVVSSKLKLNFE